MKTEAEQVLCRFQLSTMERHGPQSTAESMVGEARRQGMQGATVFEGIAGFRLDGESLEPRTWSVAHHRPVIVEVVDAPQAVEGLLGVVEPGFTTGTITLERAHVVHYHPDDGRQRPPAPGRIVATTEASRVREVRTMNIPQHGVLLRIFIGESDREPGTNEPLFRAIVRRAREDHLAGATVLKSPMGFGRHSRVHSSKLLELSTDLPIVIEIVDDEEKIAGFLPVIDELVVEGLVTLEAVRVLKYVSPDER